MSFTSTVKEEVSRLETTRLEDISELSAIMRIAATITPNISITIESNAVARRTFKLIKNIYGITPKITIRNKKLGKGFTYILNITEKNKELLEDLSIIDNNKYLSIQKEYIISDEDSLRAYLRGIFLVSGSVNDPKTSRYHLEFILDTKEYSEYVNKLLNTYDLNSKIIKREKNIALANKLKQSLEMVQKKETGWKDKIQKSSDDFSQDIVDTLGLIGRTRSKKSQNYQEANKIIEAKISNLESNMFIEIDMERVEDRSKALSYIGIEIAEALKEIPAPEEKTVEVQNNQEEEQYLEETRIEVKPSLWQKFKNTKLIRAIRYVMKIKIVVELPALPEGTKQEQDQ